MDTKKVKVRKIIQHSDILGEPLNLGNYVAIARHNSLVVCTIIKMTPKQLRVKPIRYKNDDGWLVYPSDAILLSGENALMYVLTNAKA
jgi:hypothetical protein